MSLKSTTSPASIAPTSPFSNYSNLSTSSISNHSTSIASPNYTTSLTTPHHRKTALKHTTQLSTSSPAGIAVANQVTPEKLAHLLLKTGPLAIRHITSNLAKQVNGFDKLSLSKQRRLIMSALDQGFEEESIIFEKIGWGQWSAKKVLAENFINERNLIRISNAKVKDGENARRESITKNKYEIDQHENFLKDSTKNKSNLAHQIRKTNEQNNDYAIASDDEDEESLHSGSDSDFSDEEDEQVFKLDEEDQIPPLKLSSRLFSPPLSSSASTTANRRSSSSKGIQKPRFKIRSSSQTPTSPELLYYQQIDNSSTKLVNRRHSSIRSTLGNGEAGFDGNSDTDEEDWQSIGALKLLKNNVMQEPMVKNVTNPLEEDERDAAFALVNLRSI